MGTVIWHVSWRRFVLAVNCEKRFLPRDTDQSTIFLLTGLSIIDALRRLATLVATVAGAVQAATLAATRGVRSAELQRGGTDCEE